MLDRAVWELRRYCNTDVYVYSENKFLSINSDKYEMIKLINEPTHENTLVPSGFLEKTLENKHSRTRPYLVWCNLYYSKSNRKSVLMKRNIMAENSPFYLYPEIIDEVSKYTFVSKEIRNAYKNS